MAPTPPQRTDWRRYLLWAVIWVAFVAALGYAAKEGELDFLQNDVHLALEPNRDRVVLADKTPPVIEVKVSLRNNTKDAVTLAAASACKIFRWQIFSRSGEMMQSKTNEESCPAGDVSAVLPSGQKVEEFYSIPIETPRFRKDEDFQVRYWYWGYEGAFEFRTE